jgi:hypothetical protein
VSDAAALRGMHALTTVDSARRALAEWVRAAGNDGREFLQTHLRAGSDGRFEIRHVDDRQLPGSALEPIVDPFRARAVAQTTAEGAHRPLKTAPDLRRGWRFQNLDERALWTALDYLYPACARHWHAQREGALRVTSWDETAGRQSGMYSSVRLLSDQVVADVVRACCDDAVCLRTVAWGLRAGEPAPRAATDLEERDPASSEVAVTGARVPCPEACSMFISFARAVLSVERSPRAAAPGLGMLNELEAEQIRALVEAAADGTAPAPREGEFDQPLNRRRLRYLALRLAAAETEDAPPGGPAPE